MRLFGRQKSTSGDAQTVNKEPEEIRVRQVQPEVEDKASERFYMKIEDVFSIVGKGCVVVGKVAGAAVHKNQKVIIRGRNGEEITSRVHGIEIHGESGMKSAEVGQPVGIILEGVTKTQVTKGDRLTGVITEQTLSKIRGFETLYVLYLKKTELPLVVMRCVEVYTTKEFANLGINHYKESYPEIEVYEIKTSGCASTAELPFFQYLGYLGIEDVVVDDGVAGLLVSRAALAAEDVRSYESVVRNPELRLQMSSFIAQMENKVHFDGSEEMLQELEQGVIEGIKGATYLLAAQNDQAVALLSDPDGNKFIPVFTDRLEYDKLFKTEDWSEKSCTFTEVASIASRCKGTVINPLGENMTLTTEMLQKLFEVQN